MNQSKELSQDPKVEVAVAVGQKDKPVAEDGEANPLLTPIKVVKKFIACMRTDSSGQELSDMYILIFFGSSSVPLMSGENVLAAFQHERFERAVPVSASEAQSFKMRLKYHWVQQERILEKEARRLAEAPSLHLRAESDDEDLPPAPAVQALLKPKLDFDSVSFVESFGVLRKMDNSRRGFTFRKPIRVKLTLGYRLLPASFGTEFEIVLVSYETEMPNPNLADSSDSLDYSDSSESSEPSDSSDSWDASDDDASDEVPQPAARKRQSSSNNAAEIERKRQAGTNE